MKKIFLGSSLFLVFIFLGMVSCKKEKIVQNTVTNTDTVTVNNVDTLYVNVYTPITTAVISANKWMYLEKRGVAGSNLLYYYRGGSSNTQNLDDEFIDFHTDYTATYHEQLGTERTITWQFDNSSNTKMTLHFTNTPANFDIHLENMRIKDNQFFFDEFFTDGNSGLNYQSQNIKIPKP